MQDSVAHIVAHIVPMAGLLNSHKAMVWSPSRACKPAIHQEEHGNAHGMGINLSESECNKDCAINIRKHCK